MAVFKGSKGFYEYEISDAVSYNLKSWLDYGLLEIGAYTRVEYGNPATSGYTILQGVNDDRYLNGQVWEALGPGWVWENDVVNSAGISSPLVASGVTIDGVFYTSPGSGAYSHTLDFRRGRVVFDNPVSGIIQAEYTFRDIATYLSDSDHWKIIVQQYTDKFPTLGANAPSGMAEILKENRVWLPALVIQIENRTNTGLQLGGGDLNNFQVAYHIFGDSPKSTTRLVDLLNNQFEMTLGFFDVNSIDFPYNPDGSLASGALTYPSLNNINSPYFWTFAHIDAADGSSTTSTTNVWRGECSHALEVQRYLSTF